MNGIVKAIYIAAASGAPMREVTDALAVAGLGLKGDRYYMGKGSWNNRILGKRQVSLINVRAFHDTKFTPAESRRNILVEGVELMDLIGKEFLIGKAIFCGVKYCSPCNRPDDLSFKKGFKDAFHELGGLIAEVRKSGMIGRGDDIITPS